jgi:hypothetical protein
LNAIQALSQLSYGPTIGRTKWAEVKVKERPLKVKPEKKVEWLG